MSGYPPRPGVYGAPQPPYGAGPPGSNIGMLPHLPSQLPYAAPPGFDAAPGISAGLMPPINPMHGFQPPPNINFNAPVIRLGLDTAPPNRGGMGGGYGSEGRGSNAEPLGNRSRLGLGARDDNRDGGRGGGGGDGRNLERDRAAVRESMMALQPPTREEVARTIFVGGLVEGVPEDDAIENLLRCAGKLRRWTRARDAEDKRCTFGFAEYEDVESLEAAAEVFGDGIEVPLVKRLKMENGTPSTETMKEEESGIKKEEGVEDAPLTTRLRVVVDEQSRNYIAEWTSKRREDADARQFRLDGCREDLRSTLNALANVRAFNANTSLNGIGNGAAHGSYGFDTDMPDALQHQAYPNGDSAIPTIPLNMPQLDDELADIPAEMRATVAEEIRAFRDRSVRRDVERVKREEVLEQRERAGPASTRLGPQAASPPPPRSAVPASGANGVPAGPRGGGAAAVQGAPSGPKSFRGAQMPADYVNGVAFVGANGVRAEDDMADDDAAELSDEELERRRQEKRRAELEKVYVDAERRWQNRARQRGAAQERERVREEAEKRDREREKTLIARRLSEWDDDVEAREGREEYYVDRSSWIRRRAGYREREQREDERDRTLEERELVEEKRRRRGDGAAEADAFLERTGAELVERRLEEQKLQQGFKISLGSAAARTKAAAAANTTTNASGLTKRARAMADVEGLLEDEEDAAAAASMGGFAKTKTLELKPLQDTTASAQDLTDEERRTLRQELAAEIPTDAAALFAFPLHFPSLTPAVLREQIRPFVEKKVVEYLGVQEEELVQAVMSGLEEKKRAAELVEEMEGPLGEEAEGLVYKVWRLVAFVGEAERRGFS